LAIEFSLVGVNLLLLICWSLLLALKLIADQQAGATDRRKYEKNRSNCSSLSHEFFSLVRLLSNQKF
jgi:hypothetical protein